MYQRAALRRASLLACLCAATTVGALLSVPLWLGYSFCGWDLTRMDLGYLCEVKRLSAAGQPLWLSPLFGNGAPLLGDPAAQLFYPPRWLALLLPVEAGVTFGVILHLTIGAAAATWLARTFRVRPVLAACAGIAFALSGTALNLSLHSIYIVAAAWLPCAWAAGRRALQHFTAGRLAGCALALALILLGGEAQAFCIAIGVLLIEVAWQRRTSARRYLRALATVAASAVMAFALALVVWAPALAELALSPRFGSLATGIAQRCSFRPPHWLAVLLPEILIARTAEGSRYFDDFYSGVADPALGGVWNQSPYLGPLLVTLALVGCYGRRARPALAVLLAALVLALGNETPLFDWIATVLPPVGIFRYPMKYLLVVSLAVSLLAASGAQRVHRLRRARWMWTGVAAITLIGLTAVAMAATGFDSIFQLIVSAVLRAAAPLLLAVIGCHLLPRWRWPVAVLACLDLALVAPAELCWGPGLATLQSPLASLSAPAGGPPVLCHSYAAYVARFDVATASEAWAESALQRALATPLNAACDGLASGIDYTIFAPHVHVAVQQQLDRYPATVPRALGCTHAIASWDSPPPGPSAQIGAVFGPRRDPLYFYAYPVADPVPRVYIARDPGWLDGDAAIIRHMLDSTSTSGLLAGVDDPLEPTAVRSALPAGDQARLGPVSWPNHDLATIDLAGTGGAVVGLRSRYLVGWSARQGDRSLPTVRVGGSFIGAVVADVDRGPVEFRYRPPYLVLGLVGSGLGLLLLAALLLISRGSGRRSAPATRQ